MNNLKFVELYITYYFKLNKLLNIDNIYIKFYFIINFYYFIFIKIILIKKLF